MENILEPDLLEGQLLAALHNLDIDELGVVGHQSLSPIIRGASPELGSWLYLLAESEFEKRRGHDPCFTDVLDFSAMSDGELAGALHASGMLISSQPTDRGDDFARAVCRLCIYHVATRMKTREHIMAN